VYVKHLSSLQFLSYCAFFAVVIVAVMRLLPGAAPAAREQPYEDDALGAHDRKLSKYFIGGGAFLVLGSLHMTVKNLPWVAEWLAGAGYAGHLVRDLSNTHVMIVGGGTLLATGLTWYALPRVVGRPLASEGLAQCAFWFTALGLAVFYVSLIGNGIAMAHLTELGWGYPYAKEQMGKWYKVPTGVGAGVMGLGYWCFATNVGLTIFQSRLMRFPRPQRHLWKYFATGAAALTVGTVQGVIQVQPANADWLYNAGHAGEWIDPISHAHINLVTGMTMLVAGALFALAPRLGGAEPARRLADTCFYALLGSSLTFYAVALYLGFHEGRLVVSGMSPEEAEHATMLHPFRIMCAGVGMFASFWLLLAVIGRAFWRSNGIVRPFVLAGCAALAVGTLQGPVQAVPAVNELLDKGGDAGDVIVNLHAQLNMLGGLMMMLIGTTLAVLLALGGAPRPTATRLAARAIPAGVGVYYAAGIAFSAVEAHRVARGSSFSAAVGALEPWTVLVLVPAAAVAGAGFAAFAHAAWTMTAAQRGASRQALAALPHAYAGRIPLRVRRRRPASVAAYELPLGVLGFPGLGWLFGGFPVTGSVLLLCGPPVAWAVIPMAFSPYGQGPLRGVGWKVELAWLPLSTLVSAGALYRAHLRRRRLLQPPRAGPTRPRRARTSRYRTRVGVAAGALLLLLVSLPFVPAVAGVGSSAVRYSYEPRLTREVTGQFLVMPHGPVKLFAWSDPQERYPADALRVHASDVRTLLVRAAALDATSAYRVFDLDRGVSIPLRLRSRSGQALTLAPVRQLEPGRYVFTATHEGMFGGRDFAYLRVVAVGAPVTSISSKPRATAPAVIHSLLPIAAALVSALFSVLLAASFHRRPAGQKGLWAIGLLLFAVATATEAAAQRTGWTPELFRAYYLAGGVLTVAYLGAGSAWLLLPPRARHLLLGALLLATLGAAVTVALAPVDAAALAGTAGGRPPANSSLIGHAYLWAVALNTFGSVCLIGGSLYSIVRGRRVRTNLWIGSGALIVALATGLSRAGDYSFVYAGELLGIALMFAGFRLVGAEPVRARRQPVPAAPPAMRAT
jgi:hypothetical protein